MFKKAESKKQILLVDDDKSVSQMLSMLLETRGYNVDVAHTGHQALKNYSSTTDLIILDLILPDQEGVTFKENLDGKKKAFSFLGD